MTLPQSTPYKFKRTYVLVLCLNIEELIAFAGLLLKLQVAARNSRE